MMPPRRARDTAGRSWHPRGMARLKLTLVLASGARIGPGKAALLESVRATGSISAAARAMGMDYKRAWLLVDSLNRAFDTPVVERTTGGTRGGGAHLTRVRRGPAGALPPAGRRCRRVGGRRPRRAGAPGAAGRRPEGLSRTTRVLARPQPVRLALWRFGHNGTDDMATRTWTGRGAAQGAAAAFGSGAVIGSLGGLIGLGGAEFRLTLLIGAFRFTALEAVILNKPMSLVVVASALPFRTATVPFGAVAARWEAVAELLAGSLLGAWLGRLGDAPQSREAAPRHRRAARRDRGGPAARARRESRGTAPRRRAPGRGGRRRRARDRRRGLAPRCRRGRAADRDAGPAVQGGRQARGRLSLRSACRRCWSASRATAATAASPCSAGTAASRSPWLWARSRAASPVAGVPGQKGRAIHGVR